MFKYSAKSYSEIPPSDGDSEDLDEERSSVARSHQQAYRSKHLITKYAAILLLLNITGLLAIYFVLHKSSGPRGIESQIFPAPEYETRLFHPENLKPGPAEEADWAAELPEGAGFLIIDEPERYNLPPGVQYKDGHKRYGVSWAHQYHCLWMLKTAFWELVQNSSSLPGVSMEINPGATQTPLEQRFWHLAHCFGYLRESIVCNMDMTLEYPTLKGANEGIVNGYEIPHQCKRREPLDNFIKMHAPDEEDVEKQQNMLHEHHHGR